MPRKPNLILLGIDSLRADHMSLYGYEHLTSPFIDDFAEGGTVFENTFSTHIPTTSGYANMFTGLDCFGTNIVALRHKGSYAPGVATLAEILKKEGYKTSCVGFEGNPASRGFDKYLNFDGWGSWEQGRSHKAENLNAVAIPELQALAKSGKPFFLFLRHMDPHSPYLPPAPFERAFYGGNEFDPKNKSMDPVFKFKPFCDFFACWMPPGVTDKDYIIAQYDGEIAYMDACIQNIFSTISALGLDEDTLVVLDSDHGETLYDHDCYFDHHGLYEPTLKVPLVFRFPGRVPEGLRLPGYATLKSVTPTILDILGVKTGIKFDGKSLFPEMKGKRRVPETEFYITECTWMRKHGWRTPQWKLIHALEPDFHFKPEVELYNLIDDPEEQHNLAGKEKKVAAMLEDRMHNWIARREKETGRTNPMYTNLLWHGHDEIGGPFTSSQQAYDTLHIGDPVTAQRLQALAKKGSKK
ncbi:MAG: sulfatase [Candidatus Omnitrophica bacterium]|nr:sulfatase [bacterium]MCC6732181.1 sulfatase [Candidatus Omnitrophota bacterium]MCE7907644.1 sulfatase [Candidatus Omnitrophica bacterium COP1]MBV6481649.1 Multifunctional alkaline phosphatase superfamily protein [bacterium]MCK6494645.1 sulfatase-like hydrolase/transferase [bacterium]